jgi:FixJ family two-component response regulator
MPSHRLSQADARSNGPFIPTVYIVDDDISVRESLEALVRFEGRNVLSFETAQAFLARAPSPGPGCLVLDVSLPDLNGLELQERLNADGAELPIIFITGHGDVPMTVRAMKAGAIEFMTKPLNNEALLTAISDALQRSHAAFADRTALRALRADYQALSQRERQVMALVVAGLLNKQVGGELGISEITVKAHRGQVMRKMKARSLADLVHMASRLDITTDTRV